MQKEITSKEALIRLYRGGSLYKDGQEFQPEGEITLNIQVGEKYNGKTSLKNLCMRQMAK